MENNGITQEKLISIGIGVPGCIDYEKGVLKFAVTLREWINLPLASRFHERYNVPIIVENDINTITLSESLIGAGRGHSNVVCVLIESGIGTFLPIFLKKGIFYIRIPRCLATGFFCQKKVFLS